MSIQYPFIKVKLFEKQSQLRQLNVPEEIMFLFLTAPIPICSQQKGSHHDMTMGQLRNWWGAERVYLEGKAKNQEQKEL